MNRDISNSGLELRTFIRAQLKLRKITYADLARRLGVAEITVKRWMNSHDIRLEKLIDIFDVLQINGLTLIEKSMAENGGGREYTDQQEQHFADHPMDFFIFIKALYAFPYEQILILSGKSEFQFIRSLRAMEKVGLLKLLPKNRIRVLLQGPFRFRDGGLLEKKLFRNFREVLFDHFRSYGGSKDKPVGESALLFRPFQMHLEPRVALEFSLELADLLKKYRSLSHAKYKYSPTNKAVSGIVAVEIFDAWAETCLKEKWAPGR